MDFIDEKIEEEVFSADIAEENAANNKSNPIVEILLTIFSILFVICELTSIT